jgi:hypothetical protein
MALQASGAISFLNLQTEFGGVVPIGINEYYRNGIYVPNSIIESLPSSGDPDSYDGGDGFFYRYSTFSPVYRLSFFYPDAIPNTWTVEISWNGVIVYAASGSHAGEEFPVSFVVGDSTYYRSPGAVDLDFSAPGEFGEGFEEIASHFGVRQSTTVTVNQSIPTSGQISANQFYNGRKT